VHISQIADQRVKSVSDVLKEGDEIPVKVLEIDKQGRIKLSRREALRESQAAAEPPAATPASPAE
jgi:polyribonucleotide nucleotidyltransferase